MVEGEQGTLDSETPALELSRRLEGHSHPAQRALGLHPVEPWRSVLLARCSTLCLSYALRAAPSRTLASSMASLAQGAVLSRS